MPINYWTQLSIEYANQRNYLDELYKVYPIIPDGIRDIDNVIFAEIETHYNNRNNKALIKSLLRLPLFPIKDSYIPYLRKDPTAIDRNPNTVDRICGRLYQLGITRLFENCSQPKETNRQIGPMFRRWLQSGVLGAPILTKEDFFNTDKNAILDESDKSLMTIAAEHFGYTRPKGLDFIGRFNGRVVIGEAKFISAEGGHQNAQFHDAMTTIQESVLDGVIQIAIIDGIPYIRSKNNLHRSIIQANKPIMSALVLREYLYQL